MRNSISRRGGMLFLLLFGLAISFAYAQERTVTGKVTSEEGGLPGVNIVIQGTVTGTVTDVSGNYTIVVPGPDAVLVFSSIGFTTQTVVVGNQSTINLAMVADVTSLDEIVVTAYATQHKKDITGSVSTIKAEELSAMPQGNVTQQMQGRVAGVTVTQDSRPGQAAKVRIRGFGSFQNNSPLYVVDGVPTTDINTLNPEDVESLTVLKDAGAASIYGSRASNGVIVITTKKGKSGMTVNYNMYAGTQNPGAGPDNLLDTQGMADLQWLVYANDGTSETHPVYGPSSGSPTLPPWAANTNWFDEVTRNASIMNHDLSLSGGNETSKYYASFGYFDQEGTVLTNWYKRFSARFNSEFKIKDRVTVGENLNITHRSDNGTTANSSENGAIMMAVYRAQPILPVKWNSGTFEGQATAHTFENGDWAGTGVAPRLGNGENWVADNINDQDDRWQDIRFLGNVFVDVKIIEGLNFKTSFGGSLNSWHSTNWTEKQYWNAENATTSTYGENSGYGSNWTWTNTLTYNNQFGDHNILAVAGYEAVKTGIGREVGAQRAGYFSNTLTYRTVSNGATLQSGWSSYWTPRSLVSQFLRADYNFLNKYYVSGTIRRDGASVFGEDTRYGIFPSVSGGWRISEESFLAGASFISDLKIRGGYGTMGNQLAVSTANQFYLYGGAPNQSYYDLNGTFNSSLQGFRPTRIGNPDAKWETAVNTNIGFDAVLLDRKFEVVFDWYSKQNQDLLFNPELPGTAGAADRPYINIGEMKNTGIDLQFIYRQIWSDFSFEANATFTTVNNEIIKIAEGVPYFDSGGSRIGSFNRNIEGQALGEFFGYNVTGLFQDQGEVDAAATQDGAEPGVFRYEDIDGSGTIDPDDRLSIGNPNPDFTYGLNLALGYKNFDLTVFFYGSQGNDIFNYNKWWTDFWPSFQGVKSTDLLNNSWTPSNTGASIPKASQTSTFSTNTVSNSYYIEDASFTRLKNLTLGYTFPKSFLGNVFSNARIYVQGINLFTITKYSGLDPELASFNDGYFGVDEGNLPATKQFLFGVSLGF
ncbi:MAG: TonB-dependent receptor [Bacteroidales bacterium]|nr:TonB-dependent receptor [Bacteroidales bacterium]